jgi:O-antigen/teichoic acid export membrane protein
VISAVVTLVTLPYIVTRLGLPQYGLFTLLALTTNFLGVLDLGFGWTTSRFVADTVERNDHASAANVLRISLVFYSLLGLVGCAAMLILAEPVVSSVFRVSGDLKTIAVDSLRIFGLAFPFGMLLTYAMSVLRGVSQFGAISLLQLALGPVTSALMVVVLATDRGLLGLSVVVLASQVLIAAAALLAVRHAMRGTRILGPINFREARPLARFTLAVTVASLGMQLVYLPNRLAVGVLLSLRSVGLFTLPFSVAQRFLFVPSALGTVALPAMTAAAAREDWDEFRRGFWRSMASTVLLLSPVLVLVEFWAATALRVWFSADFTESSAWVLRLSLLAILLNAIVAMLSVACDSVGKPRISAAGIVVAGIINLPLAFLMTWTYGIVGAAAALVLSFVLDIAVMLALWRRERMPNLWLPGLQVPMRKWLAALISAAGWSIVVLALQPIVQSRAVLLVLASALLAIAYGYLLLVVIGRPRIAAWFSSRTAI